jgi:colanic acid biosynthesis glycosyl transferase WcaI
MKLLVVTNLFHPDRGGGASVFSDMCYGLVQRGHDVTVYGAYPYYPEWQNKSGARLWRVAKEEINGVKVRRFGMYLPKNPSKFIPRIMFELSFMLSLLRSLFFFQRFDAVMVYCPVMGAVAYGAVRKLFYWEPTWLNVQDIPADAAAASGIAKSWLARSIGSFAQSFLFNRANVWSTIAPKMVERLTVLRKRNQPIHFVPNFLNGSMAEAIASHAPKAGRAPSRPVKLLYAGNIGKKQDLLKFCERLADAKLDFTFRIHGNGGEAARVAEWVAQRNDPRFRFGEFLDERGFVDALFDADVFVITETPGVGASFIPSKLIPGMASGTPVACVCDGEGPLGQEVREHGLGVVASWPELDQLWQRLDALLANSQEFTELQQACLRRAQAYARGPVVEHVERELTNMLRRPGKAAATVSA